jgi:hypothetical protein
MFSKHTSCDFGCQKSVHSHYLLCCAFGCGKCEARVHLKTITICVAQAIQGLLDRFQHPLHCEGNQYHPITLFLGCDQFVGIWHDAAMSTGANAIAHLHASSASTSRTVPILEQEISVARCVACTHAWCMQACVV